ncbi:MAG: glycerol-3-phosphate 1-O-acyltransferase PlsY [Phycisphaerae bacterium]|jgi:glycerol-3-phosphate acyltransferase PlsY|nr:glycerol-3-phosphate 1-O-acyltransferase PlsY [Phycisphaerae bacterium]
MIENPYILLIVFPLTAYVVGSTPFGPILARFRGVNLREHGSGNVGATNVGRTLGRRWGMLCFGLDVLKGLLPVLLARFLGPAVTDGAAPSLLSQFAWLAAGFGAILGHVMSFWLKFRGGKGVATSLGIVLGTFPYFTWAGAAALGVWVSVVMATRYVSLASIIAVLTFVLMFVAINWFALDLSPLDLWPLGSFAAAMAVLIVYLHRSNIRRLIAGTESKVNVRSSREDTDD